MKLRVSIFLLIVVLGISCRKNPEEGDYISRSHQALLKFKRSHRIPGFAFAIFDSKDTLLTVCMGKSNLGFAINEETIFSLQSISKNITALAVMKAVQDSLLDLDTPISEYLPGFTVNSCFESKPEDKITLRMLLSHTAGFTHEAPVGNNYDYTPCATDEHMESISETWLKFPVGSDYSYSNLGFDLASSIVAKAAGKDFDAYLKSELFLPLGMRSTTSNQREVAQNPNRTDGHIPHVKSKHYPIPLPGSGAVYSSLSDMIKYTQLLMNYGKSNPGSLIEEQALMEMFTIIDNHYGLGSYMDTRENRFYINHNGGGFGYAATLVWYPEYEIGSVLLSNKYCNTFDICISLMNAYIQDRDMEKDSRVTESFTALNGPDFQGKGSLKHKARACSGETTFKPEWEEYLGKYYLDIKGMKVRWYVKVANFLGMGKQKFWIDKEEQSLIITNSRGESELREFEPGLFFTDDYEVVDFRIEKVTFRNIGTTKKENWKMPELFKDAEN